MRLKKMQLYSDPGHAWLKVSFQDLKDLGLIDKISSYSYMRRTYAYLEEDADVPLFFDTLVKKLNVSADDIKFKITYNQSNKSSRIRNYASFDADTVRMMLRLVDFHKRHKAKRIEK